MNHGVVSSGEIDDLDPQCCNPDRPLLSVIVPVFNERNTIAILLERVAQAAYSKQVVVVDDGSSDGTRELLSSWQGKSLCSTQPCPRCLRVSGSRFHIIRHPFNRGKGAAIRTAIPFAVGQFTIIQDADLEYDPADYQQLLTPLIRGETQVVFGSRYATGENPRRSALYGGGVIVNWVLRFIYGIRLSDEACCYKVMATSLLRELDLTCSRFEFCPEVTAKLCRLGIPILEVPVRYTPRGYRAGKKIGLADGLECLWTLWRLRRWRHSC